MEYITVHTSPIAEGCPRVNDEGYHSPNANQHATLFARDGLGRLNRSLRDDSIVVWGDAAATLAAAAVFQLVFEEHATVPFGFGGADNPDLAIAIADLAVAGEAGYASLQSAVVGEIDGTPLPEIPILEALVAGQLDAQAARLGVTLTVPSGAPQARAAVQHVVARASSVAWALNGPAAHRAEARGALGWIASAAERDQPRRPVNIPQSRWPVADTIATLPVAAGTLDCRVRYVVCGGTDADEAVDLATHLPRPGRPPRIDDDADVFIFLHGHSSRAEEGDGFYLSLRNQAERAFHPRPVVMIGMDFPSNGYSQYVDHDAVMPLATTTRYVPDHPRERRFGILEFYERFVCAFVEALDRDMRAEGRRGITDRIVAVIGGSMGGNLALRLSEHLVSTPWWMQNAVSWSPASAYESFGNKDYLIPSPGEEVDPIGKEALERTFERCQQVEGDDSRANFLALQLNGERLINDGTPGFEAATRVLTALFQPLISGLAPLLPGIGPLVGPLLSGVTGPVVFGSAVLEGFASFTTIRQSDTWMRAECRVGYDSNAAVANATLELQERYSAMRRRTHWRVAYEQLLFSHQDVVAASGGVPCHRRATTPLLLIAGGDDTVDRMTGFDIVGGVRTMAPHMTQNDGRVVVIERTGHSIHAERPEWLAREIFDFIGSRRRREVVAVSRAETGRITRLHFAAIRPWVAASVAIGQSLGGPATYHYRTAEGERQYIHARRFLATAPDDTAGNNLRALPATRLPVLGHWESLRQQGPAEGFQVTHIRLRSSGPEPWSTWVSHLCNDEMGWQIANGAAEQRVVEGTAGYFIVHEGRRFDLRIVEYLFSAPDETTANNLSSLPVVPEGG